jgi:hypothetical protein
VPSRGGHHHTPTAGLHSDRVASALHPSLLLISARRVYRAHARHARRFFSWSAWAAPWTCRRREAPGERPVPPGGRPTGPGVRLRQHRRHGAGPLIRLLVGAQDLLPGFNLRALSRRKARPERLPIPLGPLMGVMQ